MKNLKLSEIVNIAEVIGAVAIVVSLIYVGVQVEDSTRAVRSSTANETTNALSAWYENLGTDPISIEIWSKGLVDPDSLSDLEWLQFVYLAHSLLLKYQTAFYLASEGTLDNDLSNSITGTLSGTRELPGTLRYWAERRSTFEPEFRAYVDAIVENGVRNLELESTYRHAQN